MPRIGRLAQVIRPRARSGEALPSAHESHDPLNHRVRNNNIEGYPGLFQDLVSRSTSATFCTAAANPS
jgi:hypothetical protein